MAKQPRGTGYLLLGATALVVATFAGLSWFYRPKHTTFHVFHWIPGTGGLTIVGYPTTGAPQGEDISGQLDSELYSVIFRSGISGELRLIGALPNDAIPRPQSGALILRNPPTQSHSFPAFKSRTAVYVEQTAGYAVYPAGALPGDESITITPSRPEGWFDYRVVFRNGGAGSSGPVQLRWW